MRLFVFFAFAGLLLSDVSFANTVLKNVSVNEQEESVELVFDQVVDGSQIRTEYFRDIIQLSFKKSAIYPAKILSVSGRSLKKVFAYQYTPTLVRCRLTVSGKAEDYRDRFSVDKNGKKLKIVLKKNIADKKTNSAATDRLTVSQANSVEKKSRSVVRDQIKSQQERISIPDANAKKTPKLTGSGSQVNPMKAFVWLAILIGGILGFFIIYRIVRGKVGRIGVLKTINKLTNGKIKSIEKIISVLAIHHLGPKKSIAVVQIKGRVLTIGMTDESINLLADVSAEFSEEESESMLTDSFSNILKNSKPKSIDVPGIATQNLEKNEVTKDTQRESTIRNRIKSKVHGLKSL